MEVAVMLLYSILSLVTLAYLLLTLHSNLSKNKARLPPGPPAIPIIGHLHLLRPPPHQSFHKLAERYGPLMHLRLGSVRAIVVSSPDMAREVLKTHDADFANRPQTLAARRFAYDSAGFAFAPVGPYWRFVRRLCMSELLGSRTLDQLLPVRRLGMHEFIQTLFEASRRQESVNVSWELVKMANATIRRSLTGSTASADDEGQAEEAMELSKQVSELVGAFNVSDFIRALRGWDVQGLGKRIDDVHRRFDVMMEKIISKKEDIRKRKAGGDAGMKDLVDIMLDISEDDKAEIKLTRENIKSFVLDVFTAGSDSSAATLEWALSELINHPEKLERAKSEIDEVIGKERIVEESDVCKLDYLQAIVKETLRLHPAAAFAMRETINDVRIGDYDIPAGCYVYVNLWSVGKDTGYWEEPLEFRPERFMVGGSEGIMDFRGQYFQYLPFGSGRRVCPGINLALHTVHATLAAMIQCFEWKHERMDMGEGLGVVIPRANPIMCVPVARLRPFPSLDV
ncbi:hypothetical protein J5N97_008123 [Dioscorea zingiberensis]|uniref:Uncharacterized protein n=1 Tax=Dioscorea zingiberensis TaxID=325984 RepID=A0A9D5DIE4_9LILI|nr:hypothetical protein J5N97_008123 [Dioscorea zingiberensis]